MSTTSNIIISHSICFFLIFPCYWFSLIMNHCVWRNYHVFSWIGFYNFEFNCFESSSNNECVSLCNWSICIFKVRY
jgi:hypothetical protein